MLHEERERDNYPEILSRDGITRVEVTAVIVNSSLEQAAKDKSLLRLVCTFIH